MTEIPATEFSRNFSRFREEAQHGPVAVKSHKRIAGYFLSNRDFEEYQRLKERAGRSLWAGELDDATLRALADSRMDPRHDALNDLIDR